MIGITSYLVFFLCVVLVLSILTLGLNLQWGSTGLFNAGVAGFYAIGGYTHAILTAAPQPQYLGNFGLPWIVGIAGAMALTALAALLIGLLAIPPRGDFPAHAPLCHPLPDPPLHHEPHSVSYQHSNTPSK